MLDASRLPDRFWSKVERTESCWLWTAAVDPMGYGRFYVSPGRTGLAHRVAYELVVGPIPSGLVLDHLCRTPACVNPAHLEPVTLAENLRRGDRPHAGKTTCPLGHALDYRYPDGRRGCRTCTNAQGRAYRARNREVVNARRRERRRNAR